jgi:multiple sugar transport system ATP-binding protein
VARFVGSPPMNVFETTIGQADNRIVATHQPTGVEMDLSDYAFVRQPEAGMRALVGLRPEHFSIGRPNGSKPAATFELPLRYSEKTGSDGTAFLAAADDLIAVRVDHSQIGALREGGTVKAIFPADRFNVFDAETRHRI